LPPRRERACNTEIAICPPGSRRRGGRDTDTARRCQLVAFR
jgi:hypothetical protein